MEAHTVVSVARVHRVIAAPAEDPIAAVARDHAVPAAAAEHAVVPLARVDGIVAAAREHAVAAGARVDAVRLHRAADAVVPLRPHDVQRERGCAEDREAQQRAR